MLQGLPIVYASEYFPGIEFSLLQPVRLTMCFIKYIRVLSLVPEQKKISIRRNNQYPAIRLHVPFLINSTSINAKR